jgi:hypothetical protein
MPIEIFCKNCNHELAYISSTESIHKWLVIMKKYKYKCPVCYHEIDPKELKTISINPATRTIRIIKSKQKYRKTQPKPWNPKGRLTWKPWKP